ncbi:hypothetical protein [Persephonella sp.]
MGFRKISTYFYRGTVSLASCVLIATLPMISGCSDGGSTVESTITTQSLSSTITGSVSVTGVTAQSLPADLVVLVDIKSIDESGNEIDKKLVQAENGYFSGKIIVSPTGGKIVVTASADGFSEGTKTIEYSNPSDLLNLNISIPISPVSETVVNVPSIEIGANSTQTNGNILKISFVKQGNKIEAINTTNENISALSSNNNLVMDLAIPITKLQADTPALKIAYQDFNPSNPDDYANFPGEATDDGNELISIGFDWLEITDATTGENPFKVEGEISSQLAKDELGEYYRLLRYVDCVQIKKIKNAITLDENPDKEGVQLTFYAFNSDKGAWVKAGEATFVNSYNVNYYEMGEDEYIVDTAWDYIIKNGCINDTPCDPNNPISTACVDVNNDGTYEDVSCEGNNVILSEADICENINPAYVVVSVTNPELTWKNLDYIKPAVDEVECKITIKDSQNNPLSTEIYVYSDLNGCIGSVNGYSSASTGEFVAKTIKFCDPPNGVISYFNPVTSSLEDYNNGQPVEFGQNCEINITIENPNVCLVEGVIKDSETGQGLDNIFVSVYDYMYTVYRIGYTDNNGRYQITVPCGKSLILETYGTTYTFNVNGSIDINEIEDIDNKVVLKDIEIYNNPPSGYGELSTNLVLKGSSIKAYFYAWDYEEDLPMSYKLKVLNKSDYSTVFETTGQVNTNYALTSVTIDTENLSAGDYSVIVYLVDSKYSGDINALSQSYTEISIGEFSVYEGNPPPVISYFYAYPSVVPYAGETIELYGAGYDIAGDSLTSTLTYECYDSANNLISNGSVTADDLLNTGVLEFTLPNDPTIVNCNVTWELSDGVNTTQSNVSIRVHNNPPEVYLWTETPVVGEGTQSVTVDAYIYEPENENYTCKWYINGILQDTTTCDSITVNLDGYTPPVSIPVRIEVTDEAGNTGVSEISITYGTLSEVNINIQ